MIVELEPEFFADVLRLYRASGMCFPLISAVVQNKQRGQIYVDQRSSPDSAVVITNFGFMSFLGAEHNSEFDVGFARLLAREEPFTSSYLLWYSPPASWQERLDVLGPEVARRRERVRFEFPKDRRIHSQDPLQCPTGFAIEKLSKDLVPKTEKFGVNIDSRFWSSAEDFDKNGLGVCLMKVDEVVSVCYAAAIVDGLAEIDVITEPEFRGQGLGCFVAQQFMRECLSRGITPTWDCFAGNVSSMRLAEKLEFIQVRRYPFYSFNVPIKLTATIDLLP